MASYTENLKLFKYNPDTDAENSFSISQALNENWDKIDTTIKSLSSVTNSLTEIPQRVKCHIEDGTLTVEAGTVAIVPYGLEDLTETYPVGSTFFDDNFKVVDTQYTNGLFFVWVEVQNDISQTSTVSDAVPSERFISLNISPESHADPVSLSVVEPENDDIDIGDSDTLVWNVLSTTGDDVPTTASYQWYNTTTNICCHTVKGGTVDMSLLSFPILKVVSNTDGYVFDRIFQVFNGIGYIGSTMYVDKGVKALFPDGKNSDGTVNNISWTNLQLCVYNISTGSTNNNYQLSFGFTARPEADSVPFIGTWGCNDVYEMTEPPVTPGDGVYALWYNPDTHIWKQTIGDGVWSQVWHCPIAKATLTSGIISNYHPRQVFSAADAQDIPGEWHYTGTINVCTNVSMTTSSVTYDISDYLPDDDAVYEVLIEGQATTTSTSGAYINLYIATDIIQTAMAVAAINTRTSSTMHNFGNATLPVGRGRYIIVSGNTTPNGTYTVRIFGYKRVRG